MAWLNGWEYCKKISIPAQATASFWRPVEVEFDEDDFNFDLCKSNGHDIRFTNKDLTQLKFERVQHGVVSSNICTGGTALESGHYSGYVAANLFDGNMSSYWRDSSTRTGGWAGYNFGSAKKIYKLRYCNYGNSGYNPTSVAVEYSSNGSDWTKYGGDITVTTTINTWQELNINNTTISAQYWRIKSNSSINWRCFEMQMLENNGLLGKYNVQVPYLSTISATDIYMWYGNSSAYNASIEGTQDQTEKTLTYNGDVKLDCISEYIKKDAFFTELFGDTPSGYTLNSGPNYYVGNQSGNYGSWSYDSANDRYGFTTADNYYVVLEKAVDEVTSGQFEIDITTTDYYPSHAIWGIELIEDSSNYYRYMVSNYDTTDGYASRVLKCVSGTSEETVGSVQSIDADGTNSIKCIWTPTSISLYMNDTLVASRTTTSTTAISPASFRLTLYQGSGYIDNIYVSEITPAQGRRVAKFDGSGDYFSTPSNSDFAFGTEKFTIEFLVYRNSAEADYTQIFATNLYNVGTGILIQFSSSSAAGRNRMTAIMGTRSSSFEDYRIVSDTDCPLNQVVHFAIVRDGANGYLFQNGDLVGTLNNQSAVSYDSNAVCYIGASSTGTSCLNGSLYGMCVTKGRARYTEDFTPPTTFAIEGNDVAFCSNFDTVYTDSFSTALETTLSIVDYKIGGSLFFGMNF